MQKIILAQHGNPDVHSEKLVLGKCTKDIFADKSGKVVEIDMKNINLLARALGAPLDLEAGAYLHHKLGSQVKK